MAQAAAALLGQQRRELGIGEQNASLASEEVLGVRWRPPEATTLRGIQPPHHSRHADYVARLADAYRRGDPVPPVVALRFGSELRALCGSHRIAAMGARFSSVQAAEQAGAIIILEAVDILATARAAGDRDAVHELTRSDPWTMFPQVLQHLWPHLPAHARHALRTEQRIPG
ncbi:MAG TPA: hypothetical protein VFR23_26185 [Jiangellaceae bacterium]|nr:hypothetical protein [Jiangellaceae bacterium]